MYPTDPELLPPQDPDSGEPLFGLLGYDTFSGEWYRIRPIGENDWVKPSYPDHETALEAARRRLRELEVRQPGSSSGGQGSGGIQDRVFIVHPDGRRERISA